MYSSPLERSGEASFLSKGEGGRIHGINFALYDEEYEYQLPGKSIAATFL
jgi:hypothetical protein